MGKLINVYSSFEVTAAVAAVAASGFIAQVVPQQVSSDTGRPMIMGLTKLRIELTTAVSSKFGIVVANATGTPTGPGTHNGQEVSRGGGGYSVTYPGQLLTAWSAAPTFSAGREFYRSELLPATVGAFVEWDWPEDDPFSPFDINQGRYAFQCPDGLPISAGFGVLVQNMGAGISGAVIVTARFLQYRFGLGGPG
jgi:hypothetical protein